MTNPFFETGTTPFGAPPFDAIETEHFAPAYEQALAEHQQRDRGDRRPSRTAPSFDNTIAALERSGKLLRRVDMVFSQLPRADTNDELQAVEREMAPLVARHWNEHLPQCRSCSPASTRSTASAPASASMPKRCGCSSAITSISCAPARSLTDARARALRRDRRAAGGAGHAVRPERARRRAGHGLRADRGRGRRACPMFARAAAAETARDRKLNAPFAVTTSRSSVEPILHFAEGSRRAREGLARLRQARRATAMRNDNRKIIAEIVALRAELAGLLGYETYAAYKLADTMAKTPAAAQGLLEQVWAPGRKRAEQDRDALQALIAREGADFDARAWDWRYYAEKLRRARYDFDENELKPYLAARQGGRRGLLHRRPAVRRSASRRATISPVYHPDVRVWEVERGGKTIGLFYGDYFARPGKRSGAWMTSFRDQQKLDGEVTAARSSTPAISTSRPRASRRCCRSTRRARCSTSSAMACTACCRTSPIRAFRAPAWCAISSSCRQPDLRALAGSSRRCWRGSRHYKTGEPIPQPLLERMQAARNANTGFATVEFVSSALLDMDYHIAPAGEAIDRRRVRARNAGAHRHAARDRAAACQPAFPPHLLRRRLFGRLLQLSVVAKCSMPTASGPSRRPAIRSIRRPPSGSTLHLFRRRHARLRRGLSAVPRPRPADRGAARPARLRCERGRRCSVGPCQFDRDRF